MRALLDSNILIDYLNGIPAAKDEIARYQQPLISVITWMEVMAGSSADTDSQVRAFLSRFTLVPIDSEIAEQAIVLRREHSLRLPDAIIWASAHAFGALLVSRNSKDFPATNPDVRMPYSV
jgi:hypothetical protein